MDFREERRLGSGPAADCGALTEYVAPTAITTVSVPAATAAHIRLFIGLLPGGSFTVIWTG
jgi:hypothetical protein